MTRRGGGARGAARMGEKENVVVDAEDRARIAAIVGNGIGSLKPVQRARTSEPLTKRVQAASAARYVGWNRPPTWRRRRCFAEKGTGSPQRDRLRLPGRALLRLETAARTIAPTCREAPGEAARPTSATIPPRPPSRPDRRLLANGGRERRLNACMSEHPLPFPLIRPTFPGSPQSPHCGNSSSEHNQYERHQFIRLLVRSLYIIEPRSGAV